MSRRVQLSISGKVPRSPAWARGLGVRSHCGGQPTAPTSKKWAVKIGSFDGYVFMPPEYNHGIASALKSAIDLLYAEWNNMAASFGDYDSAGSSPAMESLRLVMVEVQVATVRAQVAPSLHTEFENLIVFKSPSYHKKSVNHTRVLQLS
jgi:NAD(P)H-dependent FMN reductase